MIAAAIVRAYLEVVKRRVRYNTYVITFPGALGLLDSYIICENRVQLKGCYIGV